MRVDVERKITDLDRSLAKIRCDHSALEMRVRELLDERDLDKRWWDTLLEEICTGLFWALLLATFLAFWRGSTG